MSGSTTQAAAVKMAAAEAANIGVSRTEKPKQTQAERLWDDLMKAEASGSIPATVAVMNATQAQAEKCFAGVPKGSSVEMILKYPDESGMYIERTNGIWGFACLSRFGCILPDGFFGDYLPGLPVWDGPPADEHRIRVIMTLIRPSAFGPELEYGVPILGEVVAATRGTKEVAS